MHKIRTNNPHFMKTKKATVAYFRAMLSQNDKWAIRGLLRLYAHQVEEERAMRSARHQNGRGFSKVDADFLTGLSKQYETRNFLTRNQLRALHKTLPKYAGQLYLISVENKLYE